MGTGVSPPPWSPNKGIISNLDFRPLRIFGASRAPSVVEFGTFGVRRASRRARRFLASSAAPGAEALDLAGFRRRHVVRTASHLAHEPLLLHLAAELPKRLLELLGILDDYSHNPQRIPVGGGRCSVNPAATRYSSTSGRTALPMAITRKASAKAAITARAWFASTGVSGAAKAARA
jgi:hypothetical protein